MTKYILLIIFFSTFNLSAQECEYKEYYNIVSSARKKFSKQDYKEANKEFKVAFSKTDFPHGVDLDFALVSANKTNDNLWAGQVAEKLAKGGIPLRYFVKYKKKKWYSKFISEFEKYKEYYNQNFKPELKNKLKSLREKDAKFTRKTMDWHYGTIEITAESASDEANEILSEFKQLIDKYGFPNERTMGYNYVRRLNRVERYTTIVLMVHIYKYGVRIYENQIPNFICNGALPPESQQILKQSMGFGNSKGIENEMKVRQEKYKK